jgi:hypothetical protein
MECSESYQDQSLLTVRDFVYSCLIRFIHLVKLNEYHCWPKQVHQLSNHYIFIEPRITDANKSIPDEPLSVV